MNLPETYLGISFTISENGNGTCAWAIPQMDEGRGGKNSGTVIGGQNEAILAARKAIGLYLSGKSNLETTEI
jgi:hypothetical protein